MKCCPGPQESEAWRVHASADVRHLREFGGPHCEQMSELGHHWIRSYPTRPTGARGWLFRSISGSNHAHREQLLSAAWQIHESLDVAWLAIIFLHRGSYGVIWVSLAQDGIGNIFEYIRCYIMHIFIHMVYTCLYIISIYIYIYTYTCIDIQILVYTCVYVRVLTYEFSSIQPGRNIEDPTIVPYMSESCLETPSPLNQYLSSCICVCSLVIILEVALWHESVLRSGSKLYNLRNKQSNKMFSIVRRSRFVWFCCVQWDLK